MRAFFVIAILAVSIALTIKIMMDLDINKVIYNHAPGKCRYVEGIGEGSEDIILLSNGLALISSGIYMPVSSVKKPPGKIYMYDPSHETAKAEPLTIKGTEAEGWKADDFFPLGITVWEEKGETTVYVINSFTKQIQVFQLKINEKQLIHKKNLDHPSITNPNNVVAIGRDKFYVTNFIHFSHPLGFAVEFSQKLPFGSVWFYDGTQFVQVLDGLRGPNGIAVSKSKKHLYLATHMDEQLRVYKILSSPVNVNLSLIKSIDLYTGVDNVNIDPQGAVWIGAHPIAYKSILYMYDSKTYKAPSQVLKITFNEDHSTWRVEEMYADDGDQLMGSATAIVTANGQKVLIGTVMDKTLICQIAQ